MMRRSHRIIAAILAAVMLITVPAHTARADGETSGGKYVADVFIAYGKTQKEAEEWLIANGWEPIKGDNDFGAGKASTFDGNIVAAMGIKRTDDKDAAITDLAVMNMKGGYSVPAYEKLIEDKKNEIDEFITSFLPVLEEFRNNYNNKGSAEGKQRADIVFNILNKFVDGADYDIFSDKDTYKKLGDLFLKKTVQENGGKGSADLNHILLEGSAPAILAVEQMLVLGSDDGQDTWLQRLSGLSAEHISENLAKYVPEAAGQDVAGSAVTTFLEQHFGDYAKTLSALWSSIRDEMVWYEDYNNEHDLWPDDDESGEDYVARIDKYFDDLEKSDENNNDRSSYNAAGTLYDNLYEIEYAGDWGETLGDFFNPFGDDSYHLDKTTFLPMAAALSKGQRSALEFTSLRSLLMMGFADAKGIEYAKPDIDKLISSDKETFSVYTGVNRAIFRGGVALTSRADMDQSMGRGDAYNDLWGTLGLAAIINYSAAALSVGMIIAGGVMWAKGYQTVEKVTQVTTYVGRNEKLYAEAKANYDAGIRLKNMASEWTTPGAKASMDAIVDPQIANAAEKMKLYEGEPMVTNESSFVNKTTKTGYAGRVLVGLGGVILVCSALFEWYQLTKFYHRDFTPIPLLIVDEADIVTYEKDKDGKDVKKVDFDSFVYYEAVKCNREQVGKISDWQDGVEKYKEDGCENVADLNGDQGQEWLALYTVKSLKKGYPILADSLKLQYGSDQQPEGTTRALHLFTYEHAVDLGDMAWSFNNNKNGVYFFWDEDKTAGAGVTASAFTTGELAIAGAGGLLIGAIGSALILAPKRKKEKEEA